MTFGTFDAIVSLGDVVDELFDYACALHHLVHADLEAGHRVAFSADNLVKFQFGIDAVRLTLAHVASPARTTTVRACDSPRDGIVTCEDSDILHTVLGDDVAGEYLVVFLDIGGEDIKKRMHVLDEIGMQILHDTADAVIVECHARATGLLHDVKNLFADTQGVEQHGGRTKVHTVSSDKQAVRGNT